MHVFVECVHWCSSSLQGAQERFAVRIKVQCATVQ